ncbi:aspartyl protease family protein 2 [Aristolochia californica]|uniref:aspartyl protease family protein 2 n=1 Tax=Aristolochia californica TaxID=171875 RepID=UPI0035D87C69
MIFPLSLLRFLVFSHFLFPSGAHGVPISDYLKLPLVHKDPVLSARKALASDFQRLAALRAPVISGASTGSGQYLVDLRLGTPPQRLQLVADTGSDLVWVRCTACRDCSKRPEGSAFRARHSRTFAPFHCYNPACQQAPAPPESFACNRTVLHSTCRYQYTYADESSTSGFFSHDTVTLNASSGSHVEVRHLDFGCGFSVSGPSLSSARGVLGLGRGPISFASQVGKSFGNKFSYCLLDYTISPPPTSYLLIGDGAHQSSKQLRFTPLLTNPLSPTFYYIGIEAATVDGVPLKIDSSVWALDSAGNGGTVVDSGTTLTFLPEPAYRRILSAFRRRVSLPRTVAPDPNLEFCVNVSSSFSAARRRLPQLSFRLAGGAVFSPPSSNYFIGAAEEVQCLALQPVNLGSGFSIIGNLMQQGFLFVFDGEESRVGFSQTGCALS